MRLRCQRGSCLVIAIWLSLAGGWNRYLAAQPPPDFLEAMKQFSRQAESFVPEQVREIPVAERAQLARIEIPWHEEQRFGRQVLDGYEKQLLSEQKTIERRGRDVEYLDQLVAIIRPRMKHAVRYKRIRVGVVPTDQPDAYSIPGGDLLFTRGLLETAGSEAALVGVIAHELSHLDRGHQLLPLKQAKLTAQPTDWRQFLGTMAMMKPFHPEFEREADEDAFRWMVATGYDPRELAHLLESWDQQQNTRAPWIEVIPSFVRSHPDAGLRAASLLLSYDRLGPGQDFYIGHENWKRRLPRDNQRF